MAQFYRYKKGGKVKLFDVPDEEAGKKKAELEKEGWRDSPGAAEKVGKKEATNEKKTPEKKAPAKKAPAKKAPAEKKGK